ncbi:kinase-like domain-containing protein [Rhizophagus irregularis DAOM 181602=DAOM 197198]|nr:kinase-like domain-containing protein [Rhizophagus irregularis DAOM 181602=DAOM 197198]
MYREFSVKVCDQCGRYMHLEWCRSCQIDNLRNNFTNPNGNKIVDDLIQEMQSKIESPWNIIFEWIPYNQFNDIKELNKDNIVTVLSATWKDGPIEYNDNKKIYERNPNKKVTLKCLFNNSQNISNEFLNEVKSYTISRYADEVLKIYGISQNPITKDYIMVLQYMHCDKCGKQYSYRDKRWCKWCEDELSILYSAIWKDGLLHYDDDAEDASDDHTYKYIRNQQNKNVTLKYLHSNISSNSKIITNEFLNEIKVYSIDNDYDDNRDNNNIPKIYGISQDTKTKDYIMVLSDGYCKKCCKVYTNTEHKWCKPCYSKDVFTFTTSGNEIIDTLIQEMQLKMDHPWDIAFEWVQYNQFDEIIKICEDEFSTLYSAIWKDGPLIYRKNKYGYTRNQNKEVILKCLYNTQNITNDFLNMIKSHSIKSDKNNSDDYDGDYYEDDDDDNDDIMIVENSDNGGRGDDDDDDDDDDDSDDYDGGNNSNDDDDDNDKYDFYDDDDDEEDDDDDDNHNADNDNDNIIRKLYGISQHPITKDYVIIYPDGYYCKKCGELYTNIKHKCDSRDISNEFLNEIKAYSINSVYDRDNILKVYGISQDPVSKHYIMVLDYAKGNDFDHWMIKNYEYFDWQNKLVLLYNVIRGLKVIHQRDMVHHDFHTGNILLSVSFLLESTISDDDVLISDMGLSGNIGDTNQDNVCGIMPYVSPESGSRDYEIEKQFNEAEEYRRKNLSSIKDSQSLTTHPQAIYKSRLLNPFVEELPKDDIDKYKISDDMDVDFCSLIEEN